MTDDLLSFLVSRAQFVSINLSQIVISLVCYYDALQSKTHPQFDQDLVEYIVTSFKDEVGSGTQFSADVRDITSEVWTEGPKCFATVSLSDSLEANLVTQVAYCISAMIVYSI